METLSTIFQFTYPIRNPLLLVGTSKHRVSCKCMICGEMIQVDKSAISFSFATFIIDTSKEKSEEWFFIRQICCKCVRNKREAVLLRLEEFNDLLNPQKCITAEGLKVFDKYSFSEYRLSFIPRFKEYLETTSRDREVWLSTVKEKLDLLLTFCNKDIHPLDYLGLMRD